MSNNRTSRQQISSGKNLTFKGNSGHGRYAWLRLTPAYSLHLVQQVVGDLPSGSTVIEPFSGSGTTALAAMEMGMRVYARDINPFLTWFASVKTDIYNEDCIETFRDAGEKIIEYANEKPCADNLWQPPIFKIEKWWTKGRLDALKVLRSQIDKYTGKTRDLLDVSFCRTLIATSNAAFNHQSMSFKAPQENLVGGNEQYNEVVDVFRKDVDFVASSALDNPVGSRIIENADSREPFSEDINADLLITSPPYANRISYIRELRPYMYWMRYLSAAEEAGELDWNTIGGTWGSASTRVSKWRPSKADETPIEVEILPIVNGILEGKSGRILAPYVHKYFSDIWQHITAVYPSIKVGGEVCYIVGNSTFSGIEVPTQQWYAEMLSCAGFNDVKAEIIRKRNSNKKLFEFAVTGIK